MKCKVITYQNKKHRVDFHECATMQAVREWLNEDGRAKFITIGNKKIISCDNIAEIRA